MAFEVGSSVDRYRFEALIGQGGMGRVFRAHDSRLDRRVAAKVLSAPDGDGLMAAEMASRMLREARAAAAFNHPNAVAIYDVGEIDGTPFIAMELVEGTSLRAFIGDDRVPATQKRARLLDVARVLGAAHRAGLVHRDVKPENVLVTAEGVAKVLDFGIARRVDARAVDPGAPTSATADLGAITAAGIVVGTPRYMAPEQIRGDSLDGRCDQFGWGVMAYELLAGRLPWNAATGVQLVAALLDPHAPPLGEVAPGVDPRMAAAVDRRAAGASCRALREHGGAPDVGHGALAADRHPLVGRRDGQVLGAARPDRAGRAAASPARQAASRCAPRAGVIVTAAAAAAIAVERRVAQVPAGASTSKGSPSALAAPPASGDAKLPEGAVARAAWQAALQSYRDGQSEAWQRDLEEVVQADPAFGAAHFWLAFLWLGEDDVIARTYYARAVQLRAGHVYALAGRFADALPPLRLATRACNALQWPRPHTQALHDLGMALEGTGDAAGARSAYDAVLARWARPGRARRRRTPRERTSRRWTGERRPRPAPRSGLDPMRVDSFQYCRIRAPPL